jgi:hypothetical protein
MALERSAQAEKKIAEARSGHTVCREHDGQKPQANRRHLSLPNHPSGASQGSVQRFLRLVNGGQIGLLASSRSLSGKTDTQRSDVQHCDLDQIEILAWC